jgi:hypothetical protein
MSDKTLSPTDPPILLAGLIAARRSGDATLARYFARQLRDRFGIVIRFIEMTQGEHRGSRADEYR